MASHLWQKVKKKSLLLKVKEESEKIGLKTQYSENQDHGITSWQIDGEIMETVTDFIFLGSKITADGDWSHEIKRLLFLWRKVMINLDIILKNRDITLPSKVCLVKAMVFPAVMYGCEHWTIKKAESWRTDALKLWCWRGLLRLPWTARRSTQSILKEISLWKDWCWSWNSNTLVTWCEELTHLKTPWCLEILKVGGEGDNREWDGRMASLTQWMSLSKLQSQQWTGSLVCCSPWGHKVSDMTEQLNWSERDTWYK